MSIQDKRDLVKAQQQTHIDDLKRKGQIAAELFDTDAGKELLEHLANRFGLAQRTFLPNDRGEVNALKGAIRDGERAAVAYLLTLIKSAKPDFKLPL